MDQMGPHTFPAGKGITIGQHPHIGLGTVTYLLQGELLHKDSLGTSQIIQPGAVNWMIAGRGIVHAEITPDSRMLSGQSLLGVQTWLALPLEDEMMAPEFQHASSDSLPCIKGEGWQLRLLIGQLAGLQSPIKARSATIYADLQLETNHYYNLPTGIDELGVYLLEGQLDIQGINYEAGRLLVINAQQATQINAVKTSRCLLLGGTPLGRRHMWWNFVASERARIEQAKQDWKQGQFKLADVAIDCIPLPGE